MSHRLDLATSIHKCVRKLLFEQAMLFARAEYRDEVSCRETQGSSVSLGVLDTCL